MKVGNHLLDSSKMRIGTYILDEHREPVEVDLLTWARWFETEDRVVRQTLCAAGTCFVSTVFIGVDTRIGFGDGKPILFETMVFEGAGDYFRDRYATYNQASLYHDLLVGEVEQIPIWKHALANVRRDLRAWFDELRTEIRNWRD